MQVVTQFSPKHMHDLSFYSFKFIFPVNLYNSEKIDDLYQQNLDNILLCFLWNGF